MARASELVCAETRVLLGRLLDGELGLDERDSVLRHTEACRECAHELESARRAFSALRALPESDRTRLREDALRELGLDAPAPSRRIWRAVAVILGFVVIFFLVRARHENPAPELRTPATR